MKRIFLLFFSVILFSSCSDKKGTAAVQEFRISQNLSYQDTNNELLLKSGNHRYRISKDVLPYKKIMLMNSSLIGYITALGLQQKIIGVANPEYIYSDAVRQQILSGATVDIGTDQKYDVEKIISMKPDAVFTNYMANFEATYRLLRDNGIEVIFLDEYLEQNPLEKTAYIKVFGKLLGAEPKADSIYTDISRRYEELAKNARATQPRPSVLANEMYGGQWYLPGGKTQLAKFIADAGGSYILSDNSVARAVPLTFEEVLVRGKDAEFWLNAGNHPSLTSLLNISPNYAKFGAFRNGRVYTVAGREREKANDYFESGVLRADLVLRDYIKILHPELLPGVPLVYMKQLH